MELNENVENYFAETEQITFHPGHIIRGKIIGYFMINKIKKNRKADQLLISV
jgi:catalase